MRKINAINFAFSQYGITESPGSLDNPEVLKYYESVDIPEYMKHDSTAWCSAFVNWCCKEAGKPYSGKANAKSWLNIGKEVDKPDLGDICIFWRENINSWKGHVGFYVNEDEHGIYLLGGNQSNRVCILKYSKHQLLKIIRL